ncbi:class I SAM-dependent methyltransferase [Chondromyces crocatus]|uniref:Class I SAM-dependent methyltransferase n=1 Tax=Chondromyces crocatus TaxID=52 RepID=A0A0K1ELB4_CHOCO|nr:class I SAM-dependent methyltransferase [Chondromyces crocatus]AKT41586.1 uncharacterized protein CMC5_057930 [Chondromyces crocatus]
MPLPRVHLFEWNDLDGAPEVLRETVIESLSNTLRWGGVLRELVTPFRAFLEETGASDVLDLGAGAAGPARVLAEELQRAGVAPPRFILTDLAPRIEAWEEARAAYPGIIDFEPNPVDATAIPPALGEGRARIIINALHHFRPEIAQAVFADAVRSRAGIFIAEGFGRNPLRFPTMWPAGLPALLLNPWLSRRHRLQKAALTYLTPIVFAASAWDGFVSTLRVYTADELHAMVAPFGEGFRWRHGVFRYAPLGKGVYFYGVPHR